VVKTRSLPCFDSRSKRPSWISAFVQRVVTSFAIDRSVCTVGTGYAEILNRLCCDITTPYLESRPELVVADKLLFRRERVAVRTVSGSTDSEEHGARVLPFWPV
jgi:hypothetical protein